MFVIRVWILLLLTLNCVLAERVLKQNDKAFSLNAAVDVCRRLRLRRHHEMIFEASAESWTSVCLHILAERGIWGIN